MALPQLLRMVQELKGTLVTVMGKLVPSGVILMWSGSTDTIPAGWALCNGQDGTPDLTDRFILGAGKTYQPGTTGGAATVTPSVAARSAHAGIAVQNAALSIWTGAAGTGIGIQGTTLDGNTLPSHAHTSIQPAEYRDNGWGDSGNITFRGPTQKNGGYTGNSWDTPTAFPTPAMPMRSDHQSITTASPTADILMPLRHRPSVQCLPIMPCASS